MISKDIKNSKVSLFQELIKVSKHKELLQLLKENDQEVRAE